MRHRRSGSAPGAGNRCPGCRKDTRRVAVRIFKPFRRQRPGSPLCPNLLLAAIHRICQPGPKTEVADWYSRTILHSVWGIPAERFTSQAFGDAFENDQQTCHAKPYRTRVCRRTRLDNCPAGPRGKSVPSVPCRPDQIEIPFRFLRAMIRTRGNMSAESDLEREVADAELGKQPDRKTVEVLLIGIFIEFEAAAAVDPPGREDLL